MDPYEPAIYPDNSIHLAADIVNLTPTVVDPRPAPVAVVSAEPVVTTPFVTVPATTTDLRLRTVPVRVRCRTLNSGVHQDVRQDVRQDVHQGDIDTKNLDLIRGNNKLTAEAIAHELSVSSKTVKRHIEKMPNVRCVGSGYSGHWEIVEE